MPDYEKMYLTLFNATTDAIRILQQGQQKSEEIYIEDDTDEKIRPITPPKQ